MYVLTGNCTLNENLMLHEIRVQTAVTTKKKVRIMVRDINTLVSLMHKAFNGCRPWEWLFYET